MAEQRSDVALIKQIEELQKRLDQATDILNALRSGVVDAIVVSKEDDTEIYQIEHADYIYQVLVESMNEGALTLTKEGVILYCNKAFADMLLINYRHLIGVKLVSLISEEYIGKFESLWQYALSGSGTAELQLQYYGLTIPVYMSCNTHSTKREPSYVFAIVSNISERKRAEEALQKAHYELERRVMERTAELATVNTAIKELNQTLEQRVVEETNRRILHEQMFVQQSKMAAMGEMIRLISHQWRQPLNVISMLAQDIKESYAFGNLDETLVNDNVNTIMQQVNFMSKTIDDFTKLFEPSKEKVRFDVKSAIEGMLSMFGQMFKKSNVDISIGTDQDSILCVDGYPNEFTHVILNILNNDKDAITSKIEADLQGLIDLHISNNEERDKVIVLIKDNGGGISENIIKEIFKPYCSTKREKGTGLGLYMSKIIIENHMGGSLTVRNVDGGAEFTISLDVSKSEII
ncbi:MAG: PAS domain S-box protein [Nitrospirae bacterium]|nr:PAS domain S-box protein [Nitrospirota bacterium]